MTGAEGDRLCFIDDDHVGMAWEPAATGQQGQDPPLRAGFAQAKADRYDRDRESERGQEQDDDGCGVEHWIGQSLTGDHGAVC